MADLAIPNVLIVTASAFYVKQVPDVYKYKMCIMTWKQTPLHWLLFKKTADELVYPPKTNHELRGFIASHCFIKETVNNVIRTYYQMFSSA